MMGHRLPLSELAEMIVGRIADVLPNTPLYSLVPPNTPRPYGELRSITWEDASMKNVFRKEVVVEIGACSDQQNMQELNEIQNAQIQALTSDPGPMNNGWVVDDVRIEGGGEVHIESDEIGTYWRGGFRLRWKCRETRAIGPG